MMGRYKTEAEDIAAISGKLACAKKGIAFCQGQLNSAASKFKEAWLVVAARIHER